MITCPFDGCKNRLPDELILCATHWRMLTPDERNELTDYRAEWKRGAMSLDCYNGLLKTFIADALEREKAKVPK